MLFFEDCKHRRDRRKVERGLSFFLAGKYEKAAKLLKEREGAGPQAACKENRDEVADGVGNAVAFQEQVEQRFESCLDTQNQGKAYEQLGNLRPRVCGFGLKPRCEQKNI